jgi:hypothetical protein
LLQAAVAVRRDGPTALSRYPDFYDGKSFHYTRVKNGFILESSLKENGQPLSLPVISDVRK